MPKQRTPDSFNPRLADVLRRALTEVVLLPFETKGKAINCRLTLNTYIKALIDAPKHPDHELGKLARSSIRISQPIEEVPTDGSIVVSPTFHILIGPSSEPTDLDKAIDSALGQASPSAPSTADQLLPPNPPTIPNPYLEED